MKKIINRVNITILVHLALILISEFFLYKWTMNNGEEFSIGMSLASLVVYLPLGGPLYLLLFNYYYFINRVKILANPFLWLLLVLAAGFFLLTSSGFGLFTYAILPTDGNSGFGPFGPLYAMPVFLVAFSSLMIVTSRKIMGSLKGEEKDE